MSEVQMKTVARKHRKSRMYKRFFFQINSHICNFLYHIGVPLCLGKQLMRFPFPRLFSCHHLSTFSLGVTLTGGGREEERDRVLYLSFEKEMEEWGRKRGGEIQWYIIHHPKLAYKIIRLISLKFSLQTISLSETSSDTPKLFGGKY